jgi:hypothetical protein
LKQGDNGLEIASRAKTDHVTTAQTLGVNLNDLSAHSVHRQQKGISVSCLKKTDPSARIEEEKIDKKFKQSYPDTPKFALDEESYNPLSSSRQTSRPNEGLNFANQYELVSYLKANPDIFTQI